MKSKSIALLTAGILFFNPVFSLAKDNTVEKGLYRIPIIQPITDFDPINADGSIASEIAANLFGTLVTYRTKKNNFRENYNDVVPHLAKDWNISSDRLIYNFTLRDDIYFSNGRQLDAFDVKHTIERLARPKNSEGNLKWIFNDLPLRGFENYKEDVKRGALNPDLEGVKVIDHFIIQIVLDRPTPLLLKLLTQPQFSIIPKEELDKWGKDFALRPVGSGPYYLEKADKDAITLKKNPYYFEPAIPSMETVVYKVIPELEDEYKQFQNGSLEQTSIPDSEMTKVLMSQQLGRYSLNFTDLVSFNDRSLSDLIKEPRLVSTFLGINKKRPELEILKVRQALNYAVNKSDIISRDLQYKAIELKGIIPSKFPGADETRRAPYPYDVLKAKKLLYEAGLVDYNGDGNVEYKTRPVSLSLWYYDDSDAEKVSMTIQKNLKEVGINVNLKKADNWNDFITAIVNGQADLYHFSWKSKYPDLDKFLTPMFHSKNLGGTNISSYSNQGVDLVLTKAASTPDDHFRHELYRDVEKEIIDDAPWVFLYQPVRYVMVKPYVFGLQLHPIMNNVTRYIYFDQNTAKFSKSD